MGNFQYRAGYCLGVIREGFRKANDPILNGLMDMACTFEVQTPLHLQHSEQFAPSPASSVLHNLIVRGIPTHVSLYIEEAFQSRLKMTEHREKGGSISFPFTGNQFVKSLYEPLHLIDPRLTDVASVYDRSNLGSTFEADFLFPTDISLVI